MRGAALCASCPHSFAYLLGEEVRCPRCNKPALTAEADASGYFATYHRVFPQHMGTKRRREMSSLAKKVLAGQLSMDEVIEKGRLGKGTLKRALNATDIALLSAIIFAAMLVIAWVEEIRREQGFEDATETRDKFFASLLDTPAELMQAEEPEEVWPFLPKPAVPSLPEPKALSPTSRQCSPPQSQSETSAATKSRRRKEANR